MKIYIALNNVFKIAIDYIIQHKKKDKCLIYVLIQLEILLSHKPYYISQAVNNHIFKCS